MGKNTEESQSDDKRHLTVRFTSKQWDKLVRITAKQTLLQGKGVSLQKAVGLIVDEAKEPE